MLDFINLRTKLILAVLLLGGTGLSTTLLIKNNKDVFSSTKTDEVQVVEANDETKKENNNSNVNQSQPQDGQQPSEGQAGTSSDNSQSNIGSSQVTSNATGQTVNYSASIRSVGSLNHVTTTSAGTTSGTPSTPSAPSAPSISTPQPPKKVLKQRVVGYLSCTATINNYYEVDKAFRAVIGNPNYVSVGYDDNAYYLTYNGHFYYCNMGTNVILEDYWTYE